MTLSNRTSSSNNIFKLLKILKRFWFVQLNLAKLMQSTMPISCPPLLITFFHNCTEYMIMAQQVSRNFYHKRVRTHYGKKMLQYVESVA